MGKKSFRDRKQRAHPLNTRDEATFPPAKEEENFGDVDHTTLNWGFGSYQEALEKCESDGWKEARFYPDFTSAALCEEINSKTNIIVVDQSTMIPDGFEGNYSYFPLTGFLLNKKSIADPSNAYLVMRTEANTPAFLSGMLAGHMAERGGDFACAREYVHGLLTTPAGLIVHAGKQMVFPTVVTQGSPALASDMIVAMLEDAPGKFACSICGDSFMKFCGSSWGTEPFIAFNCDHALHPWCASQHWKKGGRSCPVCNNPLSADSSSDPVAWYDEPLSVEEALALKPANSGLEDFEIVLRD